MENEIASLRGDMLRFARLQLRDDMAAEDAVQEALAAALSSRKSFENRSRMKTWVFGILKNKIVDIIRDRIREPVTEFADLPDPVCDELFDENGHWQADARPANWGDPEKSASGRQFWTIFELCLTRLPENPARVFMMREMLGLETDEICKALGISPANCWVVLHRARMGLRLCLEERWFKSEGGHAEL